MIQRMRSLVRDEEGATMVEYALMLALIAAVCVTIVTTLGENAEGTFTAVSGKVAPPAP